MVGMAAGLALRGRVPVVHALVDVPDLAGVRVRAHRCRHRAPAGEAGRRRPRLPVGGQRPHPPGDRRHRGHARDPGMEIFCPADDRELCAGLPAVLASPAPTYIRYNARPSALAHTRRSRIGRAEVSGGGGDLAVLAAAMLVPFVAEACASLRASGVGARLSTCARWRRSTRRRSWPRSPPAACWSPSRTTCWSAGSTPRSPRCWCATTSRCRSCRSAWTRAGSVPGAWPTCWSTKVSARRAWPRASKRRWPSTRGRRGAAGLAVRGDLAGGMNTNRIAFNADYPSIASSDALYARAAA